MEITVDLSDPARVLADLQEYAASVVRTALNAAVVAVREHIEKLVDDAIRSSPEWDSLIGGTLREHFGISDASPALENILKTVKDGIEVSVQPGVGTNSYGIMVVGILLGDFSDILNAQGAEYTSVGKKRTATIPWLRWLLFEGSNLILGDVEINLKRASRKGSRTGRAIMVHPKVRPAHGWAVPEFWGTRENNWLTRALEPVGEQVPDIIFEETSKRLS